MICPNEHSFDIARSGYINLLQPQDRRSKHPGDSVAAVSARRALHDFGVTHGLLAEIANLLSASKDDVVLDVGSGEGFYLGSLCRQFGFVAQGIDISIPAVEAAAKRYSECEWVVGNADRFVPYASHSFSKVLSLTARMNPDEFLRVLQPDGHLLLSLPAADDLIELRGRGRDRVERTVQSFAPKFKLIEQQRATKQANLDAAGMEKILLSIYRPMQAQRPQAGTVTFSMDLLLFKPA